MRLAGDILLSGSGISSIGIDQSNGLAFDITSLNPLNRYFTLSGIYVDPVQGQSGVIRYSRAAAAFQFSVDGGLTFNDVPTAATVVTSVGVIGGANLTGNVDLSPTASGFINITDSAGSSPISFSLDVWGLSGLYRFPQAGFANMGRGFAQSFSAAFTWTCTHNLGTTDVVVEAYDNSSPRNLIIPDDVRITNSNTVTLVFNPSQAGRVVILGF